MATGTLSAYDKVLKSVYLPKIQKQYNDTTTLLNRIENKTGETSVVNLPAGKGWTKSVALTRHTGIGAIADGGALPTAGKRSFGQAIYYATYNYGRLDITGPTMKTIENNQSSFYSGGGLQDEMNTLIEDMKWDTERKFMGGGVGVLTRWSSGTSTTITFLPVTKANYVTHQFGSTFGKKFLYDGMSVAAWNLVAGTSATALSTTWADGAISSLTDTTFVYTDQGTPAVGDFFTRMGAMSGTTALTTYEPWGLHAICADIDPDDFLYYGAASGTTTALPFGALDIATYGTWKGQVGYNGSTSSKWAAPVPIDFDTFNKFHFGMRAASGVLPTAYYCTEQLAAIMANKLGADTRYAGDKIDIKGGATVSSWNGIPIIPCWAAHEGLIYAVHEPSLILFRMSDLDWMDRDGAILARVAGYDAYDAVAYWYMQLGTSRRNANGIYYNVDEFQS